MLPEFRAWDVRDIPFRKTTRVLWTHLVQSSFTALALPGYGRNDSTPGCSYLFPAFASGDAFQGCWSVPWGSVSFGSPLRMITQNWSIEAGLPAVRSVEWKCLK